MTKTNLTSMIDTYGALMAQRANIEGEKKRMEKALADVPEGAYEGELFRLTISDSVLKKPDEDYKAEIDAVVEAFKATKSLQYVTAHTIKTPSRRHLAKARNGDVYDRPKPSPPPAAASAWSRWATSWTVYTGRPSTTPHGPLPCMDYSARPQRRVGEQGLRYP